MLTGKPKTLIYVMAIPWEAFMDKITMRNIQNGQSFYDLTLSYPLKNEPVETISG